MGLEKALTGLLAIELLFVLAAFGVGIGLTAKDHSWHRNVDSVAPTLQSYVAVPDLLTYNVAIVKAHQLGFDNSALTQLFVQFATSDLGHVDCSVLSGQGDLYKSFCVLPKACEGLDGVCWILFLITFLIRWATSDATSSEQVASDDTGESPPKAEA